MTQIKALSLVLFTAVLAFFLNSCEETTSTTNGNPVITSVSHLIAPIGTQITIKGTDFGTEDQPGGVWFNTKQAPDADYIKWTNTEIIVKVPTGATDGLLVVENNGNKSAGVDFYIGDVNPAPVTKLRANSKNDTSIAVKWDASTDATKSIFKGYTVMIGSQKWSVGANVNTLTIGGLKEGDIYEVNVYSTYKNDTLSTASKIQWSPASRFVKRDADDEPFMMYETAASTGSGLDLFDAEKGEPYTVTVGQGEKWNVGINTKDGDFLFGSANKLGYNFTGTPASAEIAEPVIANSIDDVWDTEALDKKTFSEKVFDLNDAKYAGKKMVFVVRTMVGASTYQYAKIFVDATLKGSAGSRYVECQVSYQKKAGVPYAIHP